MVSSVHCTQAEFAKGRKRSRRKAMSQRNGQKARSNRQRKARLNQRDRIREFRAVTGQPSERISRPRNLTENSISVSEGEGGAGEDPRRRTSLIDPRSPSCAMQITATLKRQSHESSPFVRVELYTRSHHNGRME